MLQNQILINIHETNVKIQEKSSKTFLLNNSASFKFAHPHTSFSQENPDTHTQTLTLFLSTNPRAHRIPSARINAFPRLCSNTHDGNDDEA